ncbi:MAG: PD-(D/E)XK nuclease domain-containing protein [bacterium]
MPHSKIAPAIGKTDPDNEHLFTHLNIWKAGKEYTEKQGKYPVVFLSFKDIKDQDFETSLLVWLSGEYDIKSNRESGYGRYDIMLIPKQEKLPGFVIEFKKVGKKENREQATASAIKQIQEKQYEKELIDRNVKEIHKMAIVFEGKHVEVTEIV